MCRDVTYSCTDCAQHSPMGTPCQQVHVNGASKNSAVHNSHNCMWQPYTLQIPIQICEKWVRCRTILHCAEPSHLSSICGLYPFYNSSTPQSFWQHKTLHKLTNCSCGTTVHSCFISLISSFKLSFLHQWHQSSWYSFNSPCFLLPQESLQLISLGWTLWGLTSPNSPSLPSYPCPNVTLSKSPSLATLYKIEIPHLPQHFLPLLFCFIFLNIMITLYSAFTELFIFCIPSLALKFHKARNLTCFIHCYAPST